MMILSVKILTKEIAMEELVTVESWINTCPCRTKTESVEKLAKDIGTTVNTIYRWLRSGDMYISSIDNPRKALVAYRMVNFKEQ
jgi:hypothetical protein